MLETTREGNTFYKGGVGEMANHTGYVKNAMAMFISEL
jgi:hypothetical protein